MLVYLFGLCLTLFFSNLYISNYNSGKKTKTFSNYNFKKVICFLLAIFPFWFITAFRYDVGTDYLYTYVKYFEHFQKGWRPYSHEPLFQLLNICLVSLNLSYVWLFAISGFIIIACMFYYIFKYSPMPIYSV
ncbi:MAG: EpsG family protein, partial [Anaeroplasmataceae bacterium]|nr:EpsG family protein [Anaeroplasmataceae bacterium]